MMAILLCQTTIMDQQTNSRSLINILHGIGGYEEEPPPLSGGLYMKLVDGSGSYRINVRLVRMRDDSTVHEVAARVDWANPGPLDIGINFYGIQLREYGQYEFQAFADDVYMGRTFFTVTRMVVPPIPPSM